jgi:hypothetical protein
MSGKYPIPNDEQCRICLQSEQDKKLNFCEYLRLECKGNHDVCPKSYARCITEIKCMNLEPRQQAGEPKPFAYGGGGGDERYNKELKRMRKKAGEP